MDRRNFIKKSAMWGLVPLAFLAEKAMSLMDKNKTGEIFKLRGATGKWYKIKKEALEETSNPDNSSIQFRGYRGNP